MSEILLQENKQKLPTGWASTDLEILVDIIMGQAPPGNSYNDKGQGSIFVKVGEFGEVFPKEIVWTTKPLRFTKQGDVLLCVVGATIGKSNLAIDCAIGRSVAALRPNKALDTKFLFYFIRNKISEIRKNQQGSAQGVIGREFIENICFSIPPLNEQKRIAAKIDELFSKIDYSKQVLEKTRILLKQYKQSLLKSAFEGKLTEKWREENKNLKSASVILEKIRQTKSSELKKGFDKSMNELVLKNEKELPRGWVNCVLEDIVNEINSGFPSGKHNKEQKGVPHIRPMNIDYDGNIDLSDVKYVENKTYDYLRKGDVLFNNTNSSKLLGKTALIKQDTDWAYSNHMTRIRFDISLIEPRWIAYYLHKLFWEGYYKMRATNHINQSSINSTYLSKQIPILLAPLNEQKRIAAKIDEGFSLVENDEKIIDASLRNMDTLRKSILKQAFEGKLVPQDPTDESAEILLQNIRQEKEKSQETQKVIRYKPIKARKMKNAK